MENTGNYPAVSASTIPLITDTAANPGPNYTDTIFQDDGAHTSFQTTMFYKSSEEMESVRLTAEKIIKNT